MTISCNDLCVELQKYRLNLGNMGCKTPWERDNRGIEMASTVLQNFYFGFAETVVVYLTSMGQLKQINI